MFDSDKGPLGGPLSLSNIFFVEMRAAKRPHLPIKGVESAMSRRLLGALTWRTPRERTFFLKIRNNSWYHALNKRPAKLEKVARCTHHGRVLPVGSGVAQR